MSETNEIGVMRLRRSLDVEPRRASHAAWTTASELLTDFLDAFSYAHTDKVRAELADLSSVSVRLILMRVIQGLRLTTDTFELVISFNRGSAERGDWLDLPLALEPISAEKIGLTFLVTDDTDCADLIKHDKKRLIRAHVEIAEDHLESWEPHESQIDNDPEFQGDDENDEGLFPS